MLHHHDDQHPHDAVPTPAHTPPLVEELDLDVDAVLGRLTSIDGRGVVTVTAIAGTEPSRLWRALTDRVELGRWLGSVEGELRAGTPYRWRLHASGAEAGGRVELCEPPTRLRVRTHDAAGDHVLDVTLRPDPGGSGLTIAQTGLPLDRLAAFAAGLQVHVEDLLRHLDGEPRADSDARMSELLPRYEQAPVLHG
ncbi:MAG: SRPBCC domain-containing protein [Candidatus Nanopelagicales bacterium]